MNAKFNLIINKYFPYNFRDKTFKNIFLTGFSQSQAAGQKRSIWGGEPSVAMQHFISAACNFTHSFTG